MRSSTHRRSAAWLGLVLLTATVAGCGSEREGAGDLPPASNPEAAAAAPAVASPVPRHTERPDVVLVSIDSLRADHLSSYGHFRETSPRIDRLAAAGVRFETAVSTTSWTLPSHAALFTGLYDSTHGVDIDGRKLADAHLTLAEVLGGAGYRTAGFFGGPYLHPSFGLAQGFDSWQSCMTRITDEAGDFAIRAEARGGAETAHADVTGPRLLAEFDRWAEQIDGDPFFLFVHMWDVHYDFIPPPGYVERFDPDYDGPVTGRDFMQDPSIRADMPARDREHLLALYDAEIRYTDDVLARILQGLEARGRLDNTLVIVTADHGEEFFEHGAKGHRRTLFEEVIRIPLIVHWPGRLPEGRVVADPVRLIDVMPTILGLVEVPLPRPVQGRDLTPMLRGEAMPAVAALSELRLGRTHLRALRTPTEKGVDGGRDGFQWFDLASDPEEQRPGAPETPEAARLRAELAETLAAARGFAEGRDGQEAAPMALDPEIRRRLERLGYLDATEEPSATP